MTRAGLSVGVRMIETMFEFGGGVEELAAGDVARDALRFVELSGLARIENAHAARKVLLAGVTQKCNTTYHCAEEQIPDSYQLSRDIIDGVVVVDDRPIVVRSRLHVWGNRPDFGIVNPELEARGLLRTGPVGNAPTLCLDAGGFLAVCLEKMARDPRYFLTPGS